jgi:hypothetical protein
MSAEPGEGDNEHEETGEGANRKLATRFEGNSTEIAEIESLVIGAKAAIISNA